MNSITRKHKLIATQQAWLACRRPPWKGTSRRQAKGRAKPFIKSTGLESQVPATEKTRIEAMRIKY